MSSQSLETCSSSSLSSCQLPVSELLEEGKEEIQEETQEERRIKACNIIRERIQNEKKEEIQGLQGAIFALRAKNPKQYERSQCLGSSLMSRSYDNLEVGFDGEGAKIKSDELKRWLENGLLTVDELDEYDIDILNKFHGDSWKVKEQ